MSDPLPGPLAADLQATADALGEAVDAFKRQFGGQANDPFGGPPADPYRALDANGRPILADMLAARGQVLAALAALQVDAR